MSILARYLTPLVLLALAALAWFERLLPGSDWVAKEIGETAVLRFIVGALCVYVAVLVVERRILADQFRHVLDQFRRFHEARLAEAGAAGTGGAAKHEAVRLLAAALDSQDPEVRQSAHQNLVRLCGQDLGEESAAWRQWLAEQRQGD